MTTTSNPTEHETAEQAFIDAIFMCGQIVGTFSKYRNHYPERINAIRQMILATIPADIVEQYYRDHLAPISAHP